jgi:AraC-like DNA-binding protein
MVRPGVRQTHPEHCQPASIDDISRSGFPTVVVSSADRLIFQSSLMKIGCFRASPRHPLFRNSGPIENAVFVFPRTSVLIQHEGRRPFASSSNGVNFYNPGQVYWRQAIEPAGDRCEYFAVRRDVLLEALRRHDPSAADRPDAPFQLQFAASTPAIYLLQRLIVRRVADAGQGTEVMALEEGVLQLLGKVLAYAYGRPASEPPAWPAHRELARRLVEVLGTCFHEDLSLEDLARQVGCSPFFLARVFRRVDGRSIHQYRLQLRLTRSLERVALASDLAVVADELGFSSHSHFTAAFRRAFGITPSQFRAQASSRTIERLLVRATATQGPRSPAETVLLGS